MSFLLSTFLAQVDDLIAADADELPQYRRYRLIKAALEEYSRDKPNTYTQDVTGDAGKYYPLTGVSPSLTYFVDGFSRVTSIEYPAQAITADGMPIYLAPEDWIDDYWQNEIRYLYLPNHTPAATETFRVIYTLPYLWTPTTTGTLVTVTNSFAVGDYIYLDGSTWTLATDQRVATHYVSAISDPAGTTFTHKILVSDPPVSDFFALCFLAASMCCQAIATKYSRTSDSTIRADSVDHPSRGKAFAERAKEFLKRYREYVGLDTGSEKAKGIGGEFVDWNTDPSLRSGRYLFHRDR